MATLSAPAPVRRTPARNMAYAIALLLPLAMIAGAYFFQLVMGLVPCEMCWWQRYAHFTAIGFAVLGWATRGSKVGDVFIGLAGLAILAASGLGFYHMGVEKHWWEGITVCSSNRIEGDALAAILDAPLVRCDAVAWSLFGISMAGWNFIVSGLGGLSVLALLARGRRA